MLWYSIAPAAAGAVVAFVALWMAHASGLHFAGIRQRDYPLYSRLIPVGLALVAILFATSSIDYWTVMRFFGSRGIAAPADAWKDQVFSRGLPFYLFDLPFYSQVLGFVFVLAILCALRLLGHGPRMAVGRTFPIRAADRAGRENALVLGPNTLLLPGATRAGFVRIISVILLLGFAAWIFLGNYELLLNSHAFMTGADYVDEKITLPLRWLLIVATLGALPLVWMRKYKTGGRRCRCPFLSCNWLCRASFKPFTCGPNEISIERPYIERHIQATSMRLRPESELHGTSVCPFRASDGRSRPGRHAAR